MSDSYFSNDAKVGGSFGSGRTQIPASGSKNELTVNATVVSVVSASAPTGINKSTETDHAARRRK